VLHVVVVVVVVLTTLCSTYWYVAWSSKAIASLVLVSMALVADNESGSPPSSAPYPTSMDDYEFEGRIGKGAFATVYAANCVLKKERVAIKVIELELTLNESDNKNTEEQNKEKAETKSDDKEQNADAQNNNNNNNAIDISWDEIQKEASIMARMQHDNIVSCYTSFCVMQELWIIMPLLMGSCSDIMKSMPEFNNGFIDEVMVATIMRDVLNGVHYIHNDGRVHRDIKAANILLSSSGVCQIADFGVSGAIIEGGLRKHGRDTFTGSLWWMSPEVLQRENRHSYKADIWSVGITALELAFGRPPHSKQRPVKVMLTILQQPPPTIQTCMDENDAKRPKYSKKFKDFLQKTLQKDPNKRSSSSSLLSHSFMKQAKDNQYLLEHIVKKYQPKQYNNNILPNSVQQKLAKLEKQRSKQNLDNTQTTPVVSNRIESNGFDFNSEILHSISASGQMASIVEAPQPPPPSHHEQQPQPQPESLDQPVAETEPEKEKEKTTEKVGRFDVTVQNKQNDDETKLVAKGRFTVKQISGT